MKKLLLIALLIVGCEEAKDCAGLAGGTATIDDCGVCAGGISGNEANADKDCAGVCNGGHKEVNGTCSCDTGVAEDCAGVCGGTAVLSGCDNLCDSTAVLDDCGVCDGDGLSCDEEESPYSCSEMSEVLAALSEEASGLTFEEDYDGSPACMSDCEGWGLIEGLANRTTGISQSVMCPWIILTDLCANCTNDCEADVVYANQFVDSCDECLADGECLGDDDDDDNSTEPEGYLVTSSSISDGETVLSNSGLIIQFNSNLPDSFFEADTIIKEIVDTDNTIIPYTVWEIKNSQSFLLNNEPQTFWYDPNNYTCAFIGYTTAPSPDGTGEGLNLLDGINQLLVGRLFDIIIYGDNSSNNVLDVIKVVPNPYLIESDYNETQYKKKIRFTRLPQTCTITISTISGEKVREISHDSFVDGNEWWDLKDEENTLITSGIYSFQVVANENTFAKGALIINLD